MLAPVAVEIDLNLKRLRRGTGGERRARIGAHTKRSPHSRLMRKVGAELGRAGFSVITVSGGVLMEAANGGRATQAR